MCEALLRQANKKIQELEKEVQWYKDYIAKLDELEARDFIFRHELEENYVSKSAIREKIEECKENAHKFYQKKGINTGCKFCNNACNWYSRCKLLKELLGDENE